MRLPCPLCGERDLREFSSVGGAEIIDRPDPQAGEETWDAYLHLRENAPGEARDLFYHEAGCASWIVVTRNRTTHEVLRAELVRDMKAGS